ncbi:MAG: nucleotidyl transferase AbiEii/AbiGii toxin family protein [Sumerlaeia bacterium]
MYIDIESEFFGIINTLNNASIEYALCGGFAVIFHGYPRSTKDIDLLIRHNDLEKVKNVLAAECGFILSSGVIPFHIGKPTAHEIFRIAKADGEDLLMVDLLLVAPVYESVWNSREKKMINQISVSIVSKEQLIEMKRLAGRPRDLDDIEKLERLK